MSEKCNYTVIGQGIILPQMAQMHSLNINGKIICCVYSHVYGYSLCYSIVSFWGNKEYIVTEETVLAM